MTFRTNEYLARTGLELEGQFVEKGNSMTDHSAIERELDLVEFGKYLLRKAKLIAAVTLVVVLIAGIYVSFFVTPLYEATSQVYVLSSRDSAVNLSDLQIGSYLTEDYQYVFRTWEVNQQVIENLNLPYTVDELKSRLYVENPSNTRLLFITVSSEDAAEAALIANEYADVASSYISQMMLTDEPTVLSRALQPLKPVSPRKMMTILLAGLIACFLTLCILLIAFICDNKIKTSEDLEKHFGIEPLAVIPFADMKNPRRRGR